MFYICENWFEHDQGGGDRTCLQTLQPDLPRSPDPRGRRQTRRRSYLRANVGTLLTRLNKQTHNFWKQT